METIKLLEENSKKKEILKKNKLLLINICDILFFPYIRFLSISISMVLVPWDLFLNVNKIKKSKEIILILIAILFILVSFLLFITNNSTDDIFKSNLINTIILILGFIYYIYFRNKIKNLNIEYFLILYIFFGFALSIFYIINPTLYFIIRSFWTLNGEKIEVNDSLSIFRFTSTLSDPNNAAVIFVSVLTYLLFNKKINKYLKILMILFTGVIVISTMSSTGIILYGITVTSFILKNIKISMLYRIKKKDLILFLILLLILLLLSPIILYLIKFTFESDIFNTAYKRFKDNSAESRLEIWKNLLKKDNIFNHLLIGTGGNITIDNTKYSPHNGHLHLIYSYSLIPYLIFIYTFFRVNLMKKINNYLFLFVFLIGFTMNVGIYEPRYMFILALLVADYRNN